MLPVILYSRKVSFPFTSIRSKFNWMPIQNSDFVQKKGKIIFLSNAQGLPVFGSYELLSSIFLPRGGESILINCQSSTHLWTSSRHKVRPKGKAIELQDLFGLICNTLLPAQQSSKAWWELDFSPFPGHHLAEQQDFSCHLALMPVSSCSTMQVLSFFFLSSMNFSWGLQGLLQQVRHFH